MPLDVGVHERTERQDLEPAPPRVIERVADQRGADPLALEGVVDLRVEEGDQPGPRAIGGEAGQLAVDGGLEALLIRVVAYLDGDDQMLRRDDPRDGPRPRVELERTVADP